MREEQAAAFAVHAWEIREHSQRLEGEERNIFAPPCFLTLPLRTDLEKEEPARLSDVSLIALIAHNL